MLVAHTDWPAPSKQRNPDFVPTDGITNEMSTIFYGTI
jgi:hypothetical protein